MKYKLIIGIFAMIILILGFGITFSLFHSENNLNSTDQNIAKFIFNTESLDQLELSIIDLTPGNTKEFSFSVSNNTSGIISNVSVEYQMILKTYHIAPLTINLYKLNGEVEDLILTCDESFTRNSNNELICNTELQDMGHDAEALDNYVLKIGFPIEYNTEEYSDLIDYIDIELQSWQKISE